MSNLQGLLRTHNCAELNSSHIGQKVTLCGWVNKYRNLGALHFIDLRDKYGMTQLGFEEFSGDKAVLKTFSLESVVLATGTVKARPENARNDKMSTGDIELAVESIELLSWCDIDSIPFLPNAAIESTENLKLKYRYLDLRTKKLQDILTLRSKTAFNTRDVLINLGFTEVETPVLYKSTPEGARDYIVPSRVQPGKVYALPQSPQTLKQLLMIGGTDRYFQITKCFRDEDLRADRQPEFTQIDIEASFVTQESIKDLTTQLLIRLFALPADFEIPRMSYAEAISRYGSDKPDLRFGLEHHNVTEAFKGCAFSTFATVAEQQGLIKAIFLPTSLGSLARKEIDKLVEVIKPFGGKGVAWFKVTDTARSGGISKFIDDELFAKITELAENSGDGLWLFIADSSHDRVHACADALRRHLGHKLELIQDGYRFVWIYDFPLLEWSEEDQRYVARHHPFTSPKIENMDKFMQGEDLATMTAEAYDIVCNGYEIGGGSIRIHNSEVQKKMFATLGMSDEEAKHQFGFFMDALKYGTPPHGGIAFGLDRIVMLLAGTDNIRDVIAFPKTSSASDLMAEAPSVPSEAQLKELHMQWRKDC
jgi:aspartyl-tRNA synthetase